MNRNIPMLAICACLVLALLFIFNTNRQNQVMHEPIFLTSEADVQKAMQKLESELGGVKAAEIVLAAVLVGSENYLYRTELAPIASLTVDRLRLGTTSPKDAMMAAIYPLLPQSPEEVDSLTEHFSSTLSGLTPAQILERAEAIREDMNIDS